MDFVIRRARPGDERALFGLIGELARFEHLEHAVSGNHEELAQHLFGARPAAEALLAESKTQGDALGFALFFTTYSTFLTRPGLYLEDLFVHEQARRCGIGTALLREVGKIARERHAGRLEWAVLDWNANAVAFYEKLGASVLPDWRICRVTGSALDLL
ncbi:MAG TPA: GNAT family N-acetyltransferase [Polyangiaceae bacterium]|jgi:GNAT superfamily N-acetyltransferase|nr:GNAT family N-acetyltransferase [Polyangiaceae bacterium]